MEYCKLWSMIPKNIIHKKLTSGDSELEPDFLCFEENYFAVSEFIPKDYTIIDLGCYQAAQSYIFKHYKQYVGVDTYDLLDLDWYSPPERFETENTIHYCMPIKEFMDNEYCKYNPHKTYLIASAVPDFESTDYAFKMAENIVVFYPGEKTKIKGVFADEIKNLQHKRRVEIMSSDLIAKMIGVENEI